MSLRQQAYTDLPALLLFHCLHAVVTSPGDYRYEDHPEIEPGTPSWIFDANAAAARTLVAAVSAGDAERLSSAWRELEIEENIDDFYRCVLSEGAGVQSPAC